MAHQQPNAQRENSCIMHVFQDVLNELSDTQQELQMNQQSLHESQINLYHERQQNARARQSWSIDFNEYKQQTDAVIATLRDTVTGGHIIEADLRTRLEHEQQESEQAKATISDLHHTIENEREISADLKVGLEIQTDLQHQACAELQYETEQHSQTRRDLESTCETAECHLVYIH